MEDKLYLENIEEYVYDQDKIVSRVESYKIKNKFSRHARTTGDVQVVSDDVISIVQRGH